MPAQRFTEEHWNAHAAWLAERVRSATADGLLRHEPTEYARLYVWGLFNEQDFDEFNDPGRAFIFRELAKASRSASRYEQEVASWRRRNPKAPVVPHSKGRRRGRRTFPETRDGLGYRVDGGLVWFLRSFARFFEGVASAAARGEDVLKDPWVAQAEEVSLVVLLTHPGLEAKKILHELAERADIPAGDMAPDIREECRQAVVAAWCSRKSAVDSYVPKATSGFDAARRVCWYVVTAMQRQAKRQVARVRRQQSPQTIARWKREGIKVRTQEEADAVTELKRARSSRPSDKLSEKQLIALLRRPRSTVQRARQRAMASGALKLDRDPDGTWRYTCSDVRVLVRHLPRRKPKEASGPSTP